MNILKKALLTVSLGLSVGLLASCGTEAEAEDTVTIGVVGEDQDVWDYVIDKLADDGISVELVNFTDYTQPNRALNDGEIDLNAFQHKLFLSSYNEDNETDLVPIGDTVIAPLGFYSDKIASPEELEENATVAIPNDVTNGGRALLLLQTAGLLSVDPQAGTTPTVNDITDNPLNLQIEELDASQTARALQDVDVSIINSGMAVDAGFIPPQDAIFLEPVDDNSEPYVNIIASRPDDVDNELYLSIVEAYQSDDTIEVIQETSKGASIPAWK